jgi:hypothetical protein
MRTALWRIVSTGVVFALFAKCGAWSAGYFADGGSRADLTPFPFALLCGILFLNKTWAPVSVGGIFLFWYPVSMAGISFALYPAMYCAIGLWGVHVWSDAPMIGAGLVGGFFVTLAAGAVDPRGLSPLYLAAGSGLGAVAALPFVSWLPTYVDAKNVLAGDVPQLTHAFAVWQSVVGTYLFVLTRNRAKQSK